MQIKDEIKHLITKNDELKAQRDALQEKVDEFELRERCAPDYDYRQAAEMWEQAFEDKCAELHLMAEERERLFDAKHKVQAERYYWKQQVQRIVDAAYPASHSPEPAYAPEVMNYPPSQKHTDPATMVGAVIDGLRDERSEQYMAILKENEQVQAELDHARSCPDCDCCGWTEKVAELTAERDRLLEQLNRVWLKDADGKPLHIGETRYGQDGTGWRVTGFRWGSSHPVQAVDGKGRRRDLKPEWLSLHDPWESLLSELRAKGDGVTMTRTDWEKLAERVENLKGGA